MNNEKRVANNGLEHLKQLFLRNLTAALSEMLHELHVDVALEAQLHHDRPELTTVTITNADPLLPPPDQPTHKAFH